MKPTEKRVDALSPAKRALFERLLENKGLGAQETAERLAGPADRQGSPEPPSMDFSLFFFSASDDDGEDKYRLLLESARLADRQGFTAVWTPERHFHPFGGLYPSPSVVAGALAMITERVELRAGSVVLPLHHPVRVVEEWSVVDNLSRGRVSISFASGWHLDDFVLAPDRFEERKQVMLREIDTVRRLWNGEAMVLPGVGGKPVEVRTYPRPARRDPPFWLTSAGNPETFEAAGRAGLHVLTGLTGQRIEELSEKIRRYRQARAEAGLDPATGRVALMLHTYLHPDRDHVREAVRAPMYSYLRSNLGLHERQARNRDLPIPSQAFQPEDEETLLGFAFERYFNGGALFGTRQDCLRLVSRLEGIGVDEIACLVDFGIPVPVALEGLEHLARLVEACQKTAGAAGTPGAGR